ncbi:MAG: type IV pilus assembly protein PilM [Phycisphaeraceae bacterium]|nr:type IV pilus assembly protein PilM [Phycisphaeraceae bacterium]
MAASNVCWGIELGAGALKALKLLRVGDGVEVQEWVEIPHKRVLSAPDLDVTEANRLAISTLTSQHDLTGATIAVSVPGHSAFARFAKLPPVDPKKIKDIVKFEAMQQIPFPLEEVEWDYQTFVSKDSPDVEVGIFAMTRERVMERLSLWAEAGITPDIVTLSPVAVYNAVAFDQAFSEKTPGTVILDVGTTSTDLIVAEPGRMWIRTFPIGGHQFTEALVSAFKLSYLKAEKLKREAEASKHARHVFQAMRPVFGDLAQDVQRSIGYYQSLQKDANLTRLIGLGSTFSLPGLRKYLSQQLQMEVVRLENFSRLKLDDARDIELQAAASRMSTCYGLALQGLGLQTCTANLMPVKVIRDAMWKRKVKWFGLAAGLAVVGGVASFARYFMDKPQVDNAGRSQQVEQVKNEIRVLNAKWQEATKDAKDDFRAANAANLLSRREVYAYLLDDFGQIMVDAQKKAIEGGAKEGSSQAVGFIFRRWDTNYGAGPGGGGGMDSPMDERSGRRGGRTAAPPAFDQPAAAPSPRIGVTLEVETTQPNPDRFVRTTVVQWLADHADGAARAGVPYTYDVGSILMTNKGQRQIAEAEKPADEGGTPQPQPMGERPPAGRIGGKGAGGGQPIGDGVAPSRPGGSGTVGSANLAGVAPLPKAPPIAEPGSTVTTYQVYVEAIPRDPNAAKTEAKTEANP